MSKRSADAGHAISRRHQSPRICSALLRSQKDLFDEGIWHYTGVAYTRQNCQPYSDSLVSLCPIVLPRRKHIRKTPMRRYPFKQTKTDFQQFLRRRRLQTFIFQILSSTQHSCQLPKQDHHAQTRQDTTPYLNREILINLHNIPKH